MNMYGDSRQELRLANTLTLLLCAVTSFWVVAGIHAADPHRPAEAVLCVLAFVAIAAPLGAIGLTLNHMAAFERRVTRHTVRAALRVTRRRRG